MGPAMSPLARLRRWLYTPHAYVLKRPDDDLRSWDGQSFSVGDTQALRFPTRRQARQAARAAGIRARVVRAGRLISD